MVSCGRGVSVVCLPCGGIEDGSTMRWMPVAVRLLELVCTIRTITQTLFDWQVRSYPSDGRQGAYKHNWCIDVLY